MDQKPHTTQDLLGILHPYVFVLKEGREIESDLLDYTLLMLNVSPPQVIHSPGSKRVMNFLPKRMVLGESSESDPSTQPCF